MKFTYHDLDKYIINQGFNKLKSENFAAILAQVNLSSKNDFANFVKKTDFDDKLKVINKNVTSIKTKHVFVENELDELSKKVKAISVKELTKYLINKYIFNGVEYVSSGIF